tara:strand:- start:405 stop:653 length:249 start_codon:yes stop_codon:yes gene_type:complete
MVNFKIALEIWLSKKFLYGSLKTELFVGAVLAFITHVDLIISGALTAECWIEMGLTCLAPYSVVFWTATRAQMENAEPVQYG